MSKYGYKGGYNRAAAYGLNQDLDPESSAYQELQREKALLQHKKKNFDQRFGSPIFQVAKRRKWYHVIYSHPRAFALIAGCGGATIFYGGVYSTISQQWRKPTEEELADQDILIRKAFENFGGRWYSRFLPYHSRWQEIQAEDYKKQRRLAENLRD